LNKLAITFEHLHMENECTHFKYWVMWSFTKSNLVYWHKCPNNAYISYISFKIWWVMRCGISIIKGSTLKSKGANIYYVSDGHCSFLGIFVCNKNNYDL
jgi:hypothetical protein